MAFLLIDKHPSSHQKGCRETLSGELKQINDFFWSLRFFFSLQSSLFSRSCHSAYNQHVTQTGIVLRGFTGFSNTIMSMVRGAQPGRPSPETADKSSQVMPRICTDQSQNPGPQTPRLRPAGSGGVPLALSPHSSSTASLRGWDGGSLTPDGS